MKKQIHVKFSGYMQLPPEEAEQLKEIIEKQPSKKRISLIVQTDDYLLFKRKSVEKNMTLMEFITHAAKKFCEGEGEKE